MIKLLLEAFRVTKGKTPTNKTIAIIDPALPENKNSYNHREIFKKYGAVWSDKYRVPGKFWFWYTGETEEEIRRTFRNKIEPALKEVHQAEGATTDQSSQSIIDSIDSLIERVTTAPVTTDGGNDRVTQQDKDNVIDKLQRFKEKLVNIDKDEEFKEVMKTITNFRNAQGHKLSFINTILVWIQNPNAKIVKSRRNWSYLNRVVKNNAQPILVWTPADLTPYSKKEKFDITQQFIKSLNKNNYNDLTPGEKEELRIFLRGKTSGMRFVLGPNFDVSDTQVIEGKEDVLDYESYKNIEWAEGDTINEDVKPIYDALINFTERYGIKVELVGDDVLRGARGVSTNGRILLPHNEGNNVGVTKSFCHEITHEILHQSYLKEKDTELRGFFLGQEQGRQAVEQQAEISAWMIMENYGFDVTTTAINYALIWGGDKSKMIDVFTKVSGVVNKMINYIDNFNKNSKTSETDIEEQSTENSSGQVTPLDVAKFLNVEDEFENQMRKRNAISTLKESYNRFFK